MTGAEEREHRDNAAFAAIVGAQNQNRVFERHDENERPEDHRNGADDRRRGG